jgi:glycosyltransferase involved in cell wall biosynthesis
LTSTKPLVSILIPAFNSSEWIAETIESALAQTWSWKEIIVVDDGSSDHTLAIAKQFESRGVIVLTKTNEGAAAARNYAFAASKGDFIQWLDADDLLAPDKISKQIEVLERDRCARSILCGGFGRFIYRLSRAEFVPTALWHDLPAAEWLIRKMSQNLYMQTGTWLVSRELTEAAGPWDTRLLGDDDGEYFCRVLLKSDGVRFVPDSRTYYRAAGSSSLSYIGFSDKKLDAQFTSMQLHVQYLLSLEDTPRSRAACVTYLQNWMVYFYPRRMDIFNMASGLARKLEGELRPPRLSWKYFWIEKLFGWDTAQRAQVFLPGARWSAVRAWDKLLYRVGENEASRLPLS